MAIPFNMPDDNNEVEVIITQLQYLLTKLQAALRRSRRANSQNPLSSQASATRVRTNSSNRSRLAEGSPTASSSSSSSSSSVPSANLPELLNNLAWLAAESQDAIESTSQHTTALMRPMRTRTSSESSCCEESKIAETTSPLSHRNIQDWNQVGDILRKISDDSPTNLIPQETDNENEQPTETKSYSREWIFSKIVPGPVSAPLWTAMICFVGWHIFRAR